MPNTSLGFPQPLLGSNNWGLPTNAGWALVDRFLSGGRPLPGNFGILGNLTVAGTIFAGAFTGLDGTFLTSSLFNQANGIPQLNAGGKIPANLLPTQGVNVIPFVATPTFNANNGGVFNLTLTGDVTSSTFANGTTGPSVITFRIQQDGTGGHAFMWPGNVRGAGLVNPGPNIRSIQQFAVDTDGSLDATGPMMYS